MLISKEFYTLKKAYCPDKSRNDIPGSNWQIHHLSFESDSGLHQKSGPDYIEDIISQKDGFIKENRNFTYPVIHPSGMSKTNKVIVLLHGLNERNWFKHLPWAKYLAEQTGKSVILFPFSFHMNRGPSEWLNPQYIKDNVDRRKLSYENLRGSSVFNYTLSERLTELPERFFLSGYQTACDLLKIMQEIRQGQHALCEKNCSIDIFAYSVSSLLIQTMLMANPNRVFDDSKIVLFCGGALLQDMNGMSRYIMDSKAYEKVYNFYMYEVEKRLKSKQNIYSILKDSKIGISYRAMITGKRFRKMRNKMLKENAEKIMVIGMEKDKVIPVKAIQNLFGRGKKTEKNIHIFDYNFPYIHENPFPVQFEKFHQDIDKAFIDMFRPASEFLAG